MFSFQRYLRVAPALALCALPALAPFLCAQEWGSEWHSHLLLHESVYGYEHYGSAVAGLGDVDGDGHADLAVGSGHASWSVWVHSGATGVVLARIDPPVAGQDLFGSVLVGPGDVDGDGIPDLAVGSPYEAPGGRSLAGSAFVYSGLDWRLLYRVDGELAGYNLGTGIAGPGDLDGDGRPDLVIGAPKAGVPGQTTRAGRVLVVSGVDGHEIHRIDGAITDGYLGTALAAAGDADRDGVPDFLVTDHHLWQRKPDSRVWLVSGRTFQPLVEVQRPRDSRFGTSLAGAGDHDGDGLPDFLVGAPMAGHPGGPVQGAVYLFSSAGGRVIHRFTGPSAWGWFGAALAGGADLDGDGRPEVAIGAPVEGPRGMVHVFSGADLDRVLVDWEGPDFAASVGSSLAVPGDANADGLPDLLVGADGSSWPGTGEVGLAEVVGLLPSLAPLESRVSRTGGGGAVFGIHFGAAMAHHRYRLLASACGTGPTFLGGVKVPLTADSLFQKSLSDTPPPWSFGAEGLLDDEGEAGVGLAFAPGRLPATMVGRALYFAAVIAPPRSGGPVAATSPSILHVDP